MKLTPEEFVKAYGPLADADEAAHGVPALLTLAQASIESGWGEAAPRNNFFGIKADASWKGETQKLTTTEFIHGKYETIQAWFRAYPSAAGSFSDHSKFLKENGRYHKAFEAPSEETVAKVAEKLSNRAAGPGHKPPVLESEARPVAIANIFAWFVADAGYATDPTYYGKLALQIEYLASIRAAQAGRKFYAEPKAKGGKAGKDPQP